jgi:flagellar biosynthesis GTPase FlhF
MSIVLKQLNRCEIKPIKVKLDPRPVKGADIFPDLYGNLFLVAPTNTGKTTLLAYMLMKMVGKKTRVIVFCSTFYNDPLWGEIENMLAKKGIGVEVYT